MDENFQLKQRIKILEGENTQLRYQLSKEINNAGLLLENERFKQLSYLYGELLSLQELNDIYEFVINALHVKFPNTIILLITINEKQMSTRLEKVVGLDNLFFHKIFDIIGFNPVGKTFKLVESYNEMFKTGKIIEFEGGLESFSAGEISGFAASALEKLLGIHKLYTIGILKDERLLAALHFITFSKTEINDIDFVELFVRQAGTVIQKRIADQALRESEQLLKTTFTLVDVGITITDDQGNIIDCNTASERILGISKAEHIARKYHDNVWVLYRLDGSIMPTEEYASVLAIKKNTPIKNVIMGIKNKDDVIHWMSVNATPINIKGLGVLVAYIDITEQINLANDLQKISNENNRIQSFLSNDLRNSFNSILSFTEILTLNIKKLNDEDVQRMLHKINGTAIQAYSLLDDMMYWSIIQEGRLEYLPKPIELLMLVKNIFNELQYQASLKGVSLSITNASEIEVLADENMIRLVTRNLVLNAIKLAPQNGFVQIQLNKGPNCIEVCIKDNSIGMSSDELIGILDVSNVMVASDTLSKRHTRLSLSICKEFVEKHNGSIRVESRQNEGNLFCFTLPMLS